MIKGKTKITTVGGSKYILIPESLFNDSAFPFREEELDIEIVSDKIIVK